MNQWVHLRMHIGLCTLLSDRCVCRTL